ncbi:MAG: hypothetical protein ABI878_02865 [Acidobacteriota bacterium]
MERERAVVFHFAVNGVRCRAARDHLWLCRSICGEARLHRNLPKTVRGLRRRSRLGGIAAMSLATARKGTAFPQIDGQSPETFEVYPS